VFDPAPRSLGLHAHAAACATGRVWHSDKASASNNSVKPLPGRDRSLAVKIH
jgi:hypothetical protein